MPEGMCRNRLCDVAALLETENDWNRAIGLCSACSWLLSVQRGCLTSHHGRRPTRYTTPPAKKFPTTDRPTDRRTDGRTLERCRLSRAPPIAAADAPVSSRRRPPVPSRLRSGPVPGRSTTIWIHGRPGVLVGQLAECLLNGI